MKLQRPNTMGSSVDMQTATLCNELLNSVTTIHKLHLKITGIGSFAAHKALNEFYDGIGDNADSIIEQYQGASERLLEIPDTIPVKLNSVDEAISYFRNMTAQVNALQAVMPYSEIVNQLDEVKSLIDSTKYKLIFLK
jgi:DNA-binding ferritin-like protein